MTIVRDRILDARYRPLFQAKSRVTAENAWPVIERQPVDIAARSDRDGYVSFDLVPCSQLQPVNSFYAETISDPHYYHPVRKMFRVEDTTTDGTWIDDLLLRFDRGGGGGGGGTGDWDEQRIVNLENQVAALMGGTPNFYVYDQATDSDTWAFTHTMPYRPTVTLVDTTGAVMFGAVTWPTVNSVQVLFSHPVSGSAYCS